MCKSASGYRLVNEQAEKILVKRKDLDSFVRIEYEKISAYCNNYGEIGHERGEYRGSIGDH